MSSALTISDVGLRLIKAYEGFRPVDVELMSGQRVAGYGHRVMSGESLHLSEKKAEKLLRRDLAPYEAMINDSIFAPLSQSQFDALCSLAFNIGPKKFLESDVVRALNNGRVLDAANGFDIWRKGEINGESYVIDALVRRRTAEKVLFLRPSLRAVRAPRVDLEAAADDSLLSATTAANNRIFEDSGLVPNLNYEATEINQPGSAFETDAGEDMFVERRNPNNFANLAPTPMRRRDDRPGGVLTHSELFDEATDDGGDPLIKDLDGFNLDLTSESERKNSYDVGTETPELELTEIAEYDDFILADGDTRSRLEIENSKEAASENNDSFEPSDYSEYIVGDQTGDDIAGEDILELTELDDTPSPIAAAAAEVSGRLDALMAQQDGGEVTEADNKILPFRSKASSDDAARLRLDNGFRSNPTLVEDDAADVADIDLDFEENQMSDYVPDTDNSAARYIANTVAPAKAAPPKTGLNLMVIIGMIMLAVSAATMMSGFDQRFGPGGEFLSTVGAILGFMITLGSIYYIYKNMRDAR